MKKIFSLVLIACMAIVPALLNAQDSTKAARKMEMRKAFKEKWQNATPEEKEKMKERAKAVKAKYDSLPPEKQEQLKAKMKARRGR